MLRKSDTRSGPGHNKPNSADEHTLLPSYSAHCKFFAPKLTGLWENIARFFFLAKPSKQLQCEVWITSNDTVNSKPVWHYVSCFFYTYNLV